MPRILAEVIAEIVAQLALPPALCGRMALRQARVQTGMPQSAQAAAVADWLREAAGLKDAKLAHAVAVCGDGLIETVHDLRDLHEADKLTEFKDVVAVQIQKAFAAEATEPAARQDAQEICNELGIETGWALEEKEAQQAASPTRGPPQREGGGSWARVLDSAHDESAEAELVCEASVALREWRGDWEGAREWKAVRVLGRGGSGVVLLLDDKRLGALALKLIRLRTPEDRRRLKREASAMKRTVHPNVCVCHNYHVWPDETLGGLLMEFVAGGPRPPCRPAAPCFRDGCAAPDCARVCLHASVCGGQSRGASV